MDKDTRNRIQRATQAARTLLEQEYAEQLEGVVQRVSYELLRRGRDLADKRGTVLCAMIFGKKIDEDGLTELIERGADRVVVIEAPDQSNVIRDAHRRAMNPIRG